MLTELGATEVYCPRCDKRIGQVYEWEKCRPRDPFVTFKATCPYCNTGFRAHAKVTIKINYYLTQQEELTP